MIAGVGSSEMFLIRGTEALHVAHGKCMGPEGVTLGSNTHRVMQE